MREPITKPIQLQKWRLLRGLSQPKAAEIFDRSLRGYQYLEAGTHLKRGTLPRDIDAFAQLYEIKEKKAKR